jgi:DNA-binding response OmpR family regulator
LPGKTGAELIKELRRRDNQMPAIVMSAFTDDDTIAIARKAGAREVLAKPVDLGLLFALMKELGTSEGLILLLEDDQGLAENVAEALAAHGYQVQVERSVKDAIGSHRLPEAAILDLRLPDGSGIEVADRLTARNPGVRILFVTGHADELARGLPPRLMELDRMEKPFDVARLLTWVGQALGRK